MIRPARRRRVRRRLRGPRSALRQRDRAEGPLPVEPTALLRFKQEFQHLADLVHPNLVTLHELLSDGGAWCFTMELIEGVDFLSFVRVRASPPRAHRAETLSADLDALVDGAPPAPSTERLPRSGEGTVGAPRTAAARGRTTRRAMPPSSALPVVAAGRRPFRSANPPRATPPGEPFCSIRSGSAAASRSSSRGLRAPRRQHPPRDLKPSNVLVTREGRVVLLDFGIAKELAPRQPDGGAEREDLVGTPAYMPPERLASAPETAASDWYSVGVMLYEALRGELPFSGSLLDVISAKMWITPPPPSLVVDGIPRDLDDLCAGTSCSATRPRARRARRSCSSCAASAQRYPVGAFLLPAPGRFRLVGRERELGALEDGFRESAAGRTLVVLLAGRSGMGKRARIELPAGRSTTAAPPPVLLGRCHER